MSAHRLFGASLVFAILVASVGCGDHGAQSGSSTGVASAKTVASAETSAQAAATTSSAAPESSATAANDIPSPADFEDDADTDIGTDNYVDELGKLEKEIDAN